MSNPNDRKVLNAILNPNTPFEEDEEIPEETKTKYELTEVIKQAKELEAKGVKEAEGHNLDRSIEYFSAAIEKAPEWASSYNNRAQAYRLKGDMKDALNDLEKAIAFSTKYSDFKVLSLAYAQKGTILRLEGKDKEAYECFKVSASHGNGFSKHQLVCLNPYAALCNKMLTDLFKDLREGKA